MISILLPDLRGGGAERVSLDLAVAFKKLGHEVEFVLMQEKGVFLEEARAGFPIFTLNANQIRQVTFPLARYLRARRPNALIANMWPLTSAAVIARILTMTPTRLLLVEHTTLSLSCTSWGLFHHLVMRASLSTTYRMADRAAAVSEGAARDTAKLAGMATDRIAVLHNPIPQRRPPLPEAIAAAECVWGCPPGKRILSVGNLKEVKNYPLLLRAFAAQSRLDARLLILGSGDETSLERLAVDLCVADRVIFAGFRSDPSSFYATADVFVLSSDYEGFGNVLVEALSFGLPVVSTNCPSGPAEILENGRWGHLTPVGDAAALARAMDEALSTPVDREALKRRAADFSPEIAARKYLDLLGLS